MATNAITVSPYTQDVFIQLVCPGALNAGDTIPDQVRYLARYCECLGAQTIVREQHYMDRHYVDEYAFYYSRMLSPPTNAVARIHLFAGQFSEEQFSAMLERSLQSTADRETVERQLMGQEASDAQGGYLGYVSVRPVPSVPIGRTIVARLPNGTGQARHIWTTNPHTVHLANLRLSVEGLAFQQQDAAVGACATAALWSSLVRIARHDGMRAPTPAEISEAATRVARPPVRPMLSASTGLTVQQLCEATRTFGFTPEIISARGRPEIFVAALHTYLLSGIPVVLALRGGGIGHAVTAVGFQMSDSEHQALQASVPVTSAGMTKLYVHDDRLGPYARARIEPFSYRAQEGDLVEGLIIEIGSIRLSPRYRLDNQAGLMGVAA